ncbi:hypothetical protein AM1_D0014 (plasmid) [Acaryochloris marina MBIC11017]|uniref:Uncharacterized protein n=1 Tax=Acaryochloris marina (strain MBIC 11017) TaxID=329726 RepID=A8ZNC5_ACAM1|nr:hypothetical protein AM1_D0014 [Acaryochloris marina MBIC11017]
MFSAVDGITGSRLGSIEEESEDGGCGDVVEESRGRSMSHFTL